MAMPGFVDRLDCETIASAATISPKSDVVVLTGTTSIANIIPPNTGGISGCRLILVTTGAGISLLATGNIAVAFSLVTNVHKSLVFVPKIGKWV